MFDSAHLYLPEKPAVCMEDPEDQDGEREANGREDAGLDVVKDGDGHAGREDEDVEGADLPEFVQLGSEVITTASATVRRRGGTHSRQWRE